jgi:hypothetical protein
MSPVFISDISKSKIFDTMNYRCHFLFINLLKIKIHSVNFESKFLKIPMYEDNSGDFQYFQN